MESEAAGMKPFRGGQAGIASTRDAYPSPEAPVQQNLHDVILSRKTQHFENIAHIYERLSIALDQAKGDGFDFFVTTGRQDLKSVNATIPSSMPIPRSYDIEFDVRYNPPM